MKKFPYKYKHLVIKQIIDFDTPHPLDNIKDKTVFIKYFTNDLGINAYDDISGGKNNLFRIALNNLYYNIFIEFSDGGGKDISFNKTKKKVAIPFHQKAFKNMIDNLERVLVVNLYTPLDENGVPDFTKRVYAIVDPMQIYASKVISKNTQSSSSRWFTLEDVIDVINSENYKLNNKKNVYIVYWQHLKDFFEKKLKHAYVQMLIEQLKTSDISNLYEEKSNKYNKYRRLFRDLLISNRELKCEIIQCNIKILELMVASHIKPVNAIIKDHALEKELKIQQISDPNNGFLLCPNHDALFDRFLITFDANGKLLASKFIAHEISKFNLSENIKSINIYEQSTLEYLKFHNQQFFDKQL